MIPKRLFWMGVGAAAGAGASLRAQQVVRKKVAPYTPERLPGTIVSGVRSVGDGVRGAVADGRSTMRAHETKLRSELPVQPRRTPRSSTPLHPVGADGAPSRSPAVRRNRRR